MLVLGLTFISYSLEFYTILKPQPRSHVQRLVWFVMPAIRQQATDWKQSLYKLRIFLKKLLVEA